MAAHGEPFESLGEVIRRRRCELGLTQEALAERIGGGMRQSDVSKVERGEVTLPRRRRLEQIAAALETSLGTMMTEAGWLEDPDPGPET